MIIDCNGGKWPVHSAILRLRFPVFRDIEELKTVLVCSGPGEVDLLLRLAYGGDRCSTIAEVKPRFSFHRKFFKGLISTSESGL